MLQRRMLYIVSYIDAKLRKIYFWHRADLISFKREGDNEYEGDQELLVCCHPGLTARSDHAASTYHSVCSPRPVSALLLSSRSGAPLSEPAFRFLSSPVERIGL